MDFAVPANHRVKLKECEKRDKYIDLAREMKKTVCIDFNSCHMSLMLLTGLLSLNDHGNILLIFEI